MKEVALTAMTAAMSTTPDPVWKVTGWTEKVFQPCPGEPWRAAGCCENCGQSIRYVVSLRNQFGVTMEVGQDCAVTMVGGEELREIRRAEREYERRCYLESPECARADGMRAGAEFARRERAANAEITYFMQLEGFRKIAKSPNVRATDREWAQNVVECIMVGRGCPEMTSNDSDERRSTGVLYAIACLPASEYVGRVGEKLAPRKALFEMCIPFDTQYGRSYVQKFRCEDGAVLVWFSKGGDGTVGEWVTISGTVKGHDFRYNEKQTIMTRCKVKALNGPIWRSLSVPLRTSGSSNARFASTRLQKTRQLRITSPITRR